MAARPKVRDPKLPRQRKKRRQPASEAVGDAPRGRTVALNRRARFQYEILQRLEAGIALKGSEIKSIRAGAVSLAEGFVTVDEGEAYLRGVHVALYKPAAGANHEPTRPRKLLLHRVEIGELARHLTARGHTAVPLRVFLERGRAKVEIGIVRGARRYDKRQRIREREDARVIARFVR